MGKINIFLAGSIELVEEREAIQSLITYLTGSDEFKDTPLICKSCKNSGDKQSEYNNFIESECNVLIQIIGKEFGIFSQEEFLRACIYYEKNERPDIYVFVKEGISTLNLHDIETIQNRTNGKYVIKYKDIENLKSLVEERMRDYKKQYQERERLEKEYTEKERVKKEYLENEKLEKERLEIKKRNKPINKFLHFIKYKHNRFVLTYSFIVTIMLICYLLFTIKWYLRYSSNTSEKKDEVLLLAGGGTIEGYLLDQDSIDIAHSEGMVYVPMPSSAAWPLIYEEMSKLGYNENSGRPYYPIIMSSKRAEDKDFVPEEQIKQFTDNIGSIVEVFLGYDTLQVFAKGLEKLDIHIKERITDKQLAELITKNTSQTLNVFTTTVGKSGTYAKYAQILNKNDCKLEEYNQTKNFYRNQKTSYFNDGSTPFIVLGSKGYHPSLLVDDVSKLNVISTAEGYYDYITNPLYLYTVAYNYNNKYIIPNCVCNFLRRIGLDDFPDSFEMMPSSRLIQIYDKTKRQLKEMDIAN